MNCQNCGAPIDLSQSKCPYCETPYEKKRHKKKLPPTFVDCSGLMTGLYMREDVIKKAILDQRRTLVSGIRIDRL